MDYKRLKLSVEQKQTDGSTKVLRIFDGKTLHGTTVFGGCTFNCHPVQHLIEDAVRWLHEGGLEGGVQTVIP